MTSTFKSGQLVYDKQGAPALYGREVHGGHLVFPCVWLDGDDGECSALNYVTWPEVFASAPAESLWPAAIFIALFMALLAMWWLSC
jgi:hypothetical protein